MCNTIYITKTLLFQEKFNPHILHKVAIFFNPRQKSMKVLSAGDRVTVTDYITDQLEGLPLRLPTGDTNNSNTPPTKRRRLAIDEFDDDVGQPGDDNELTRYQALAIQPDSCQHVLTWWKQHAAEFPSLSTIARGVLCVMPTSAPSERNFSLAGHVVNKRRSCLASSSVNDILLVNSSMK